MKNKYCYIVDSGLQVLKVEQNNIQFLLDQKKLAIKEIVGTEDITDLIEYLLVEYKLYNKYDIQYIVDYLNDLICEIESNEV